MKPLIPYFEPLEIPIAGDFGIHGFGILVALGFVFGAKAAMRKAARDGLEPELINRLVGWMVLGVFVGGHLGHLLMYYPEQLKEDPMVVFRVWQGLSSFGGFVACAILGIWFFRREKRKVNQQNLQRRERGEPLLPPINLWAYSDAALYGFTLSWFLGRMGCFTAHDHPGLPTEFFLGVYGMCPDQPITVACHDLGLYEALWSLAMFGIFVVLDRKPRFPGFYTGVLFVVYGPVRLVMDLFRHPDIDTRYFGMTPAQYGSILMTLVGVWMLWSRRKKTPTRIQMKAFHEKFGEGSVAAAGGTAKAEEPATDPGVAVDHEAADEVTDPDATTERTNPGVSDDDRTDPAGGSAR